MAQEFPVEKDENGNPVILIDGDLDSEMNGEALRGTFANLLSKNNKEISFDMTKVQNINSYGIGRLLVCNKILKDQGGTLTIIQANGFVEEILKLLMINKLIEMK